MLRSLSAHLTRDKLSKSCAYISGNAKITKAFLDVLYNTEEFIHGKIIWYGCVHEFMNLL